MAVAGLATALATVAGAAELTQRAWLLRGVPATSTLSALRAGGLDGIVLPVGEVKVVGDTCRLTLSPLPDLAALAGWPVTPLVWVSGQGEARGNPETFMSELAPVGRSLPGSAGVALAARAAWPGLLPFAGAVAKHARVRVDLLLPAQAAAALPLAELPPGVKLVVAAFGNPPALGLPPSTIADDLDALAAIDDAGAPYRVALVVTPRALPPPGPAGASLARLARPNVAEYSPGERGDDFVLRRSLDWGGTTLAPPATVSVEVVDTSRYHRDLGLVLRSVRPRLEGWDVAGLPDREPALGMSVEAFLDYLQGGKPYPTPVVEAEWTSPTRLRVALANPTPHASALATAGNWLELRFSGSQLLDVGLGDFSGADYGRLDGGTYRRTAARDASVLRLFLTYLSPTSRLGAAVVSFIGRPATISATWVLRLGDGRTISGPVEPLAR